MNGFEVVETLCVTAKDTPEANEDRLVLTKDFVAVIDGATSAGAVGGVPGGILAADSVARTIRDLDPQAAAAAFVTQATRNLAEAFPDIPPSIARPSASAVVWSARRNEIWRVGDCHFRIDDKVFVGDKALDRLAYDYRCAVARARLALGLTDREAEKRVPVMRQPFRDLVLVQHAFANLDSDDPLAYGSLNGVEVPARFVNITPVESAREIVLCSDGFPTAFATLSEGLEALRELKRRDPLLIEDYRGSRPFRDGLDVYDDTTYVRLKTAI